MLTQKRESVPRWQTTAICVFLAVVTFATFREVLHYDFVEVDDHIYVTENARVLDGLSLEGIRASFFGFHLANWHPLTLISLMLDTSLFGVEPGVYHRTALLLHVASTLLLFLALRKLTGVVWRPAFVAALFALHPLHVEPVVWISSRKDVLSALFLFTTLWAYARYVETKGRFRYIVVCLAFALALASKPMVMTLPFVLLLLDFWPLSRFGEDYSIDREKAWPLLKEKLPLFAMTAVSVLVTYWASASGGGVATLAEIPLLHRLENVPTAYVLYIWKTIWPTNLSPLGYPIPAGGTFLQVLGGIAILGAITLASIRARRRAPYLIVGWLWFVGMLVPVIGIVSIGKMLRTDRYTYLPLVGLFIAAVWGMRALSRRFPLDEWVLPGTGCVVLMASAILSWNQASHWQNADTLFERMARADPGSVLGHQQLGQEAFDEKNYEQALYHFKESLAIKPTYPEPHFGLGRVFFVTGDIASAEKEYQAAILYGKQTGQAYGELGLVQRALGHYADAERSLAHALELNPNLEWARRELEIVRSLKGTE